MTKGEKVILISAIAMTCILSNVFAATREELSRDYRGWQNLQKGMTEEQVVRLLGEPLEKKIIPLLMVWQYQQEQETGIVRFKKKTGVTIIHNWVEPNWNILLAKADAERLERDQVAMQAEFEWKQAAKQAELENEQALAEKKRLDERRIEQRRLNMIRTEEARKRRAEREIEFAEFRKEQREAKAELRPIKLNSPMTKYFKIVGLLFIAVAIAIVFFRRKQKRDFRKTTDGGA